MRLQRHLTRAAHVPIRQLSAKASQAGDFRDSGRFGIESLVPRQKGKSCRAAPKVAFL
jgi:hypothetical protein